MKQLLIRNSLICGLVTFAANLLIATLELPYVLMWTANIFPGFIFGFVLASVIIPETNFQSFLFILLSGGIYILAAWIATGYSFLGNRAYLCFPAASIVGAVLLMLAYKFCFDLKFDFVAGLKYILSTGVVSSVLPVIGDLFHPSFDVINGSYWLGFIFTLSVFVVWQPMFAWSITRN